MTSSAERLRRLFRLAPGERALLARAWALTVLVELALRVLPFRRVLALCQRPSPRARPGRAPAASIERLVWLVEVAGRYTPGPATCLREALVLSRLLSRRGIATTFRIGVARDPGTRLAAHAWLERDGQALGRPPAAPLHQALLAADSRAPGAWRPPASRKPRARPVPMNVLRVPVNGGDA